MIREMSAHGSCQGRIQKKRHRQVVWRGRSGKSCRLELQTRCCCLLQGEAMALHTFQSQWVDFQFLGVPYLVLMEKFDLVIPWCLENTDTHYIVPQESLLETSLAMSVQHAARTFCSRLIAVNTRRLLLSIQGPKSCGHIP